MDEVENFCCQFPNPLAFRVSVMGCYTVPQNVKKNPQFKSTKSTIPAVFPAFFHSKSETNCRTALQYRQQQLIRSVTCGDVKISYIG
jgi:hypothetical protein